MSNVRPYDTRHEAEGDAGLEGNEITLLLGYNYSFLPSYTSTTMLSYYNKYQEE